MSFQVINDGGPAICMLGAGKAAVAPSARRLAAILGADCASQGDVPHRTPDEPTTRAAASIAAALEAL